MITAQINESWKTALADEFGAPYMLDLKAFLVSELQQGKMIFPKGSEYFRALNLTPLPNVKIVILGQDPYHGEGQAHGLSFSVRPDGKIPPSLRNIYKELQGDLNIPMAQHGFLEDWARQGVLLLNSVLTVENGKAGAHQGKGWERFTDAVIRTISRERSNVVFMLWGAYAHKKADLIDDSKHLILTSTHPSPLSAHRGFLGCGHFSKANAYLENHGQMAIDWKLPPLKAIKAA